MSEELQRRAVELAWRHWTALGVAGVAPLPKHAIDVEALIAFTPFIAASDPRLEREAVDWCTRIAPRFVSISRLRQLVRLMPPRAEGSAIDLPKLVIDKRKGGAAPRRLSRKSRSPRLDHPSLVQLRSRYVFGVGARADVVVALVMRPRDAEVTRMSSVRPIGYTRQAVAMVVDELAQTGVLEKFVANQTASYTLIKGAPLRALLAPLPKRAPSWPQRFALIANILETWRRFGTRASYGIELAKALDKLHPLAASIGERAPIVGRPQTIISNVDRWSSGLLEA